MKSNMIVRTALATALLTVLVSCGSDDETAKDAPSTDVTVADTAQGASGTDLTVVDTTPSEVTVDETSRALLPAALRESGELRLGASFRVPPFSFYSGDGTVFSGISYEMASLGAERLGLVPVWSAILYPGQTPAIKADRIDLVWETTSVNEERLKAATFVIFAHARTSVLVAKGNPKGINSLSDMCGNSIGASRGSIFVSQVEEQSKKCEAAGKPPITQLVYDSAPSGRTALQSNQVDGFMGGQAETYYFAEIAGDGEIFSAVDLSEIAPVPLGIQFDKGEEEAAIAFASLVDGMIADGSYQALFEKWALPDSMMVTEAEILL